MTSSEGYTFCGDLAWSLTYDKASSLRRLEEVPFTLDVTDLDNPVIRIEANDVDSAGTYDLQIEVKYVEHPNISDIVDM